MGVILPILSVVGEALGIGGSLFDLFKGHPNISVPKLPTYSIPTAQLDSLNAQIDANNHMGAQARQAAQEALSSYSKGQLSAAYSGQYEAQYNKELSQLQDRLAGMGFSKDSSQYQAAVQHLNTWAASLKSQLLQSQLHGAMSAAGLSDEQIQSQLSEWQVEDKIQSSNSRIGAEQEQLKIEADKANADNSNQIGQAVGSVATGLGSLGTDIGKLYPTSDTKGTTLSSLPSNSQITQDLNKAGSLKGGELSNMGGE